MKKLYFSTALFFSLLSFSAFSQVPSLGMASSYRIFTVVGAINSTGNTVINGNIGSNAGAFNFASPGVITGTVDTVSTTSLLVATDVANAFTDFGNIACDSTLPVLLGNGQILKPKTYCIGALTTLSGNLILDGNNDPGAVFIFNIGAAFSTGIGSSITTINGASLSNVYWRVQGQVNLGGSSDFGGTLLIDGGSLNLASGAELQGRGLVVNGAVTLADNIVSAAPAAPLPVTLLSFKGQTANEGHLLSWSTATEKDVAFFALERSADGKKFEQIGKIAAKNRASDYELNDPTDLAVAFYRLNMVDKSGSARYSNTLKLERKSPGAISISGFPNPARELYTIRANNGSKDAVVTLTDCVGRVVVVQKMNEGTTDINLNGLPAGFYAVRYQDAENSKVLKVQKL